MTRAKRSENEVSVAFRLPRELHEHLKKAGGERGLSEEIRRRLEWSLVNDWQHDPKTRDLVDAIANLARNTKPYFGAWHENPYAFDVFSAAVNFVLQKVRPKGEPVPPPDDGSFHLGHTPEAAGRALAATEIIARNL
jgi:hypothetical protein